MCSTLRVICTCDQCDSAFCALQLTALIKPNWCISMISLALKTTLYTRLKICICKTLLLHRPGDFIDFTLNCPPTFCNKIAPMCAVISLPFIHVPSFTYRSGLWRSRADCSTVGLYCVAKWQQIRKGSFYITVAGVLLHETVEGTHLSR